MLSHKYLVWTFLSLCLLPAFAGDDDHWDTRFGAPGADGLVNAITCSGSNVFAVGSFTSAGESGCIGVGKWNGSNWSGFGSGFAIGSGPIGFSIATRGPEVYAGGFFITNIGGVTVRNLGKWNGSSWSEVGGGINGIAYNLLFKGNDLYVSGVFTQVGNVSATNIARWDGTNWYPLGTGLTGSTNGLVGALGFSMTLDANGDLIVVGNFRFAGGVEANNVARWDGSQWHALGSGVYNGGPAMNVNAVVSLGTNLYVAGLFKSASGVNATNVARWDGTQWNPLGGGPFGTNYAMVAVGSNLFVAGAFTNIGGVAARHVARWNGGSWQPLAPGTAGEILTKVSCLGSDGTNLYAGGDFVQAGTNGTLAIAKWDGIQWSALAGPKSQGAWLSPATVAVDGTDVYIGGSGVLVAGGLKPNRIAHWNGSAWDNMSGGVTGGSTTVATILPNAGTIYIGGNFTNAGGVVARNVAYWNGFNWNAMGSGFNNTVSALCFHNGQLFAGGSFTARGDGSVNLHGIAVWDGSEWQDVPIISSWRINNVINALVSDGVNLYMGGNYYIGWFEPMPPYPGEDLDNIGYWDGSRWHKMGNGLTNTVNALAFVGSDLYAGGSFTTAGNATPIRRIAKWNGSVWTEVGGGITNGTVNTLAGSSSKLFVGGSFTSVGGVTNRSRLLTWNGSQWSTLGSGIARISPSSSSVSDIAISVDDVYVVGSFSYAGGRPSASIGHWNETIAFVPPTIRLINAGLDGFGQFRFDVSGLSSGTFTIQASTNLIDWSDIYSDIVPNTNFTDNLPLVPKRNYRVKAP